MAKPDYTACETCGVQIELGTRRPRKYCSDYCRYRAVYVRKLAGGWKHKKKQSVMTCKECGTLFLRMPGGSTKWCSDGCKPPKQRLWFKATRTLHFCAVCDQPYVPKISQPSKYCHDCRGKRYEGTSTCIECGSKYFVTSNSGGKFCSFSCNATHNMRALSVTAYKEKLRWSAGQCSSVEWRDCICCKINKIGPRPPDTWAGQFCIECREILGAAISTHNGRIDFLQARLWGKRCEICGNIFEPPQEQSRCCSKDCYKQTEEFKARQRAQKLKRRAQKKTNGPYENIDPLEVFDRDDWRCYLCGIDTPEQLRGSLEPNAPELDHIDPLSRGGTHTWENVACACRQCNQKKSDKEVWQIEGEWFTYRYRDDKSVRLIEAFAEQR